MSRVLEWTRSPIVRWTFVVIALTFIVLFVLQNASEIGDALARLTPIVILAVALLCVVYVMLTLQAWRSVLRDLGHSIAFRSSVPLFGVSQLAKYVPGGVWNIVAAAELGTVHGVPRRTSVASMTVTLLISVISGTVIGLIAFAASPPGLVSQWGWVLWIVLPLALLLLPPILNRALGVVWRLARLQPLDSAVTVRGVGVATGWSLCGWIVAGIAVFVLAIDLGAPPTVLTLALCVGGYAIAWITGFLFVIAPAGIGVREVVLAVALAGVVDAAEAAVIVLILRVVLTGVDLVLAAIGAIDARIVARRQGKTDGASSPEDDRS